MLKRKCVYKLKAKLIQSDGKELIYPFTVLAENSVNAYSKLEKYLTESKDDTGLKYDTVDYIWNVDTDSIILDIV